MNYPYNTNKTKLLPFRQIFGLIRLCMITEIGTSKEFSGKTEILVETNNMVQTMQ